VSIVASQPEFAAGFVKGLASGCAGIGVVGKFV
jgi:hypothetical protein